MKEASEVESSSTSDDEIICVGEVKGDTTGHGTATPAHSSSHQSSEFHLRRSVKPNAFERLRVSIKRSGSNDPVASTCQSDSSNDEVVYKRQIPRSCSTSLKYSQEEDGVASTNQNKARQGVIRYRGRGQTRSCHARGSTLRKKYQSQDVSNPQTFQGAFKNTCLSAKKSSKIPVNDENSVVELSNSAGHFSKSCMRRGETTSRNVTESTGGTPSASKVTVQPDAFRGKRLFVIPATASRPQRVIVKPPVYVENRSTQTLWQLRHNESYFFIKNTDENFTSLDSNIIEAIRNDPLIDFYKTKEEKQEISQDNPKAPEVENPLRCLSSMTDVINDEDLETSNYEFTGSSELSQESEVDQNNGGIQRKEVVTPNPSSYQQYVNHSNASNDDKVQNSGVNKLSQHEQGYNNLNEQYTTNDLSADRNGTSAQTYQSNSALTYPSNNVQQCQSNYQQVYHQNDVTSGHNYGQAMTTTPNSLPVNYAYNHGANIEANTQSQNYSVNTQRLPSPAVDYSQPQHQPILRSPETNAGYNNSTSSYPVSAAPVPVAPVPVTPVTIASVPVAPVVVAHAPLAPVPPAPVHPAPVSYYPTAYHANQPFYYPSFGWNSYPPPIYSGWWESWPLGATMYPDQAQYYYPTSGIQGQPTTNHPGETASLVEGQNTTSYQNQSVSTIHLQTTYQRAGQQHYYDNSQEQFQGKQQSGFYQDQQVGVGQEEMSGYLYPQQCNPPQCNPQQCDPQQCNPEQCQYSSTFNQQPSEYQDHQNSSYAAPNDSSFAPEEYCNAPEGFSSAEAGASYTTTGASYMTTGASNTTAGASNTGAGSSNTGAGASNTTAGASNTGAGSRNVQGYLATNSSFVGNDHRGSTNQVLSDCPSNLQPFRSPIANADDMLLRSVLECEETSVSSSGLELTNLEPVSVGGTQQQNVQQTVIKKRQPRKQASKKVILYKRDEELYSSKPVLKTPVEQENIKDMECLQPDYVQDLPHHVVTTSPISSTEASMHGWRYKCVSDVSKNLFQSPDSACDVMSPQQFSDHTNVEEIYNKVGNTRQRKSKSCSKSSSPTLNTPTTKAAKATTIKALANANNLDNVVRPKNTFDEEMTILNQVLEVKSYDEYTNVKESGKVEAYKSIRTNGLLEDCVEIDKEFAQTAVNCVLIPTSTQKTASLTEDSELYQYIDTHENEKDEDFAPLLPEWMEDEIKDLDKYREHNFEPAKTGRQQRKSVLKLHNIRRQMVKASDIVKNSHAYKLLRSDEHNEFDLLQVEEKVEGNEYSSMDDYIAAFYDAQQRMCYSYQQQHLFTSYMKHLANIVSTLNRFWNCNTEDSTDHAKENRISTSEVRSEPSNSEDNTTTDDNTPAVTHNKASNQQIVKKPSVSRSNKRKKVNNDELDEIENVKHPTTSRRRCTVSPAAVSKLVTSSSSGTRMSLRSRSNSFEKPNYNANSSSDEVARELVGNRDNLTTQGLSKESKIHLKFDKTFYSSNNEMLTENINIEGDDNHKLTQSGSRKRKGEPVLTHSVKKKPVYRKVLTISDIENMSQDSNKITDDSLENDVNPRDTGKLFKEKCDKENDQIDMNSPSIHNFQDEGELDKSYLQPISRSPQKGASYPYPSKGLNKQMDITAKLRGIRKLKPKVKDSLGNGIEERKVEDDATELGGDNKDAPSNADDEEVDLEKVIPVLRVTSKRGNQKIKKQETPLATRKSKRTVKKKLPADDFVSYADEDISSKDLEVNLKVDSAATSIPNLKGIQELKTKDQQKNQEMLPTEAHGQQSRRSKRVRIKSQKGRELEIGKEEVTTKITFSPIRRLAPNADVTQCIEDHVTPSGEVTQIVAYGGDIVVNYNHLAGQKAVHPNQKVAHNNELAAHPEVVHSDDLAAPHIDDNMEHCGDLTQQSDLELVLSEEDLNTNSDVEDAHSDVEVEHCDDKEEDIIAGNMTSYSSEASHFICNDPNPTKSDSSHAPKLKSLMYSSISTPPKTLVRLIGVDYNKDEKDSKDLVKRFGKYGQMFIDDETSLTPSRLYNQ